MVRVEFSSCCQAFGWWMGQKGSIETEAGAGVVLSCVVLEVRPLGGKGWVSWYIGKDERETTFAWKEFWPQKATQGGRTKVGLLFGFKTQLCSPHQLGDLGAYPDLSELGFFK